MMHDPYEFLGNFLLEGQAYGDTSCHIKICWDCWLCQETRTTLRTLNWTHWGHWLPILQTCKPTGKQITGSV